MVQGTLDLLILKVVALEPQHGWVIAQRIRQMSGDVLQVGQSGRRRSGELGTAVGGDFPDRAIDAKEIRRT
jgi:hypothetical protein